MDKEEMLLFFRRLNEALAGQEIQGELLLTGGAVMVLAFDARRSTKDIDAIMEPASTIRELAAEVASEIGLPPDVLNDGVKGFIYSSPEQVDYLELSNLRINTVSAEYLLAMKCCACRMDIGHDLDDIRFLIDYLGISDKNSVFQVVMKYVPADRIPPKTGFFIEEIFNRKQEQSNNER